MSPKHAYVHTVLTVYIFQTCKKNLFRLEAAIIAELFECMCIAGS